VDPLDFLLGLERLGMKFGLENITRLCAALGNPERAFKSAIIAGTNGKGSVSAMVSAALTAAGHRTGRYTSPHLERLEERFVIDEQEIAREDLRSAAGTVQAAVERLISTGGLEAHPTFFECATAIAFELFRRAEVDVAVLEVGLGGRLDATNVVTPLAAAITSIALDHEAQLGGTLAAVAREKAGVIKAGIPVVCGPLPPEADHVVAETCRERNARMIRTLDRVVTVVELTDDGTVITLDTPHHRLERASLALSGRHQASNAATAVTLLEELDLAGISVNREAILAGLTAARWPGRLERFRCGRSEVLLDAAHNPAGTAALAAYLQEIGWSDATMIFGAMRDKDLAGMLAPLAPAISRLICTTTPGPRAAPASQLAAIARPIAGCPEPLAIDAPEEALRLACADAAHVVVAGSIFLIGPLRGILR
jgi:dihydrofolate synthase/folylpolyglutamate synthase